MSMFPQILFAVCGAILLLVSFMFRSSPKKIENRLSRIDLLSGERPQKAKSGKLHIPEIHMTRDMLHFLMQAAISFIVLYCVLRIIMSHGYDAQDKHWAYGTAGMLLGYWLKGK